MWILEFLCIIGQSCTGYKVMSSINMKEGSMATLFSLMFNNCVLYKMQKSWTSSPSTVLFNLEFVGSVLCRFLSKTLKLVVTVSPSSTQQVGLVCLMSELLKWDNMAIRWMLLLWANTLKIRLFVPDWYKTKIDQLSFSSWNAWNFCHRKLNHNQPINHQITYSNNRPVKVQMIH